MIPCVTQPFCDTCNRLRLTAEGQMRNCLFALDETDLRGPMREGATDDELVGVDARHDVEQVVRAPDQPPRLRAAGAQHVDDRRLKTQHGPDIGLGIAPLPSRSTGCARNPTIHHPVRAFRPVRMTAEGGENMVRGKPWFITSVVILTMTVGGVAIASNRVAREQSLTVYTETAKYRSVDNGKEGFSVGDHDVFFDKIWGDEAKTERLGTDRVVVEYLPTDFVMVQVEYTFKGEGKIYAAGTLDFGESFPTAGDDLAIVGGTGTYENVGGSVHLSVFDDETFTNEIHLLP